MRTLILLALLAPLLAMARPVVSGQRDPASALTLSLTIEPARIALATSIGGAALSLVVGRSDGKRPR